MRRSGAAPALLALAFLLGAPAARAQCAMCRTALTNSPEGRAMGAEFNRAILVMLAAPYLVTGTLAAVFFRRRLRAALAHRLGRLRPAPAGARARG